VPRTSANALAAVNFRAKAKLPAPPRSLNQEARKHWKRIVAARPVNFFSEGNLQLLEQYCRTLVFLRQATDLLDTIAAEDAGHFAEQAMVVSRLTRTAVILATKLRLTIQATVRGDAAILKERREHYSPLLGGGITSLRRE